MSKAVIFWMLGLSFFSYAEETDSGVSVIITDYEYDSFGRQRGKSVRVQQGPYYDNNPYYDYPYDNSNLPGSDPNRMEELFEQNSRR